MLLVSGLTLVVGEPVRELINPIFWIKMAFVVGLVLLSLCLQAAVRRQIMWNGASAASVSVRTAAAAIIVMWCVVIFAGRWIAYAPA